MNVLLILLSILSVKLIDCFSISSIRATHGEDVHNPAQSGENAQDIDLICQLQLNPGDHWTSCAWTHQFPDVWGLTNTQGFVMCSAGSIDDNGKDCSDVGNLLQYGGYGTGNEWVESYVDRLEHLTDTAYCGLRIKNPNANDTGIWRCKVNDNSAGISGQNPIFWKEIGLFVANKSEVVITDPVMTNGGDNSLWADITTKAQTEIRASCESRYGVPPPQLVWYIDEPRNKISDSDARISSSTTSSSTSSGSNIEITKSSISMDINERSLNSYGIRGEHGYFSFTLGCYPRQDSYFTQDVDNLNPAEVMVFGHNAGSIFTPSSTIFTLTLLILSKLF